MKNLMEELPQWRQLLAAYLRKQAVNPDDPNIERWVWQSAEYETNHTVTAIEWLKRFLGGLEGKRILDFGCGAGLDAINVAKCGAEVTGTDLDVELIAIARLRAQEAGVAVCFESDFDKLLASRVGYYDALISLDVIEHVEGRDAVYQMAASLVRPGGYLIISTPNPWALTNILADPHWKLFGVSLMPRRLASWYVVHWKRAIKEYNVYDLLNRRQLLRCVARCDCEVIFDSLQEIEDKLSPPLNKNFLRRGRKLGVVLEKFFRARMIRQLAALCYGVSSRRSWWVLAKKSAAGGLVGESNARANLSLINDAPV